MKTTLPIALLSLVLLSGCATAPKRFVAPSTLEVHKGIREVRNDISSAKSDAAEAKKGIAKAIEFGKDNKTLVLTLTAANGRIDNLTKSLLAAETKAGQADKKLTEKDNEVKKIVDNANKTNAKAFIAIKRYHRLKFWLCMAGAGVVAMLVWQFKALLLVIPPPYNIIAGVAAPVATFSALWLIL